jgi:hypothetical protein
LIHLLYEALASPYGKVVETSDVERLRQALYKARRDSNDVSLDCLAFCQSPTNPEGELWIVKK